MTKAKAATAITAILFLTAALAIAARSMMLGQDLGHFEGKDKVLYVWAQDQTHVAPDFLAVINFDEESSQYGAVIRTVPVPPPGNVNNEPHHCHLNSSKTILGCGGLLSVLKGQNGIFFFDVTNPTQPQFLFSTYPDFSKILKDNSLTE
jgi:hypothetical protein